ncbi:MULTISPECIES: SurA N-terminal domain-containing protein [unclassified Paenibacillus]|uniref:peptidyl-prolyl cis-trans isomerase n=1 Tax=unclassified Paenibacillus TaxID=185978 RepID=UPI001C0F84C2|nr:MULTISPECIES: SurA N-terminal domain-containing protein [unclassified Paenibacillus]MBU5444808.1 SurA N-terminal domain-containing protein [Paenibacillus sp. MSJ-34]
MTRIEKGLWAAVALLFGCVVVLSCMILMWGLNMPGTEKSGATATPSEIDETDGTPVAEIGGETVTAGDLREELVRQYGAVTLQLLLTRKAFAKEAVSLGLDVTDREVEEELRRMMSGYPSERAYYDAMFEQFGLSPEQLRQDTYDRLLAEKVAVSGVKVSDREVDEYIAAHADQYRVAAQYNIAQIVVKTKPDALDALKLLGEGQPFPQVARQVSLDYGTADNGGALGWIGDDDPFVDANILSAARGMQVGDISEPILLDDGRYAVIQLTGKEEPRSLQGDELRKTARKDAALQKGKSVYELEQELREKYNAVILDPRFIVQ